MLRFLGRGLGFVWAQGGEVVVEEADEAVWSWPITTHRDQWFGYPPRVRETLIESGHFESATPADDTENR